MIMGCLLDLGADPNSVRKAVESVGCRLEISQIKKHHIAATRARVISDKKFHSVQEARSVLKDAKLEPSALEKALNVLETLAFAEAKVHGVEAQDVHFHEIGVLDALADIAGSSAAFQSLGLDRVFSLSISSGGGTVSTSHGLLPVPAPATLEILRRFGLIWKGGPVDEEVLTPTGAAILANFVDEIVDRYPEMRAESVGYGAGKKDLEIPNVLRGVIGNLGVEKDADQSACSRRHHDRVVQLETNVDDVTGEVLGNLLELLMEAGALDASIVPALMKKGRPGNVVKVIATAEKVETLAALIMKETGSLGLRVFPSLHRYIAQREERSVSVVIEGKSYEVSVKLSHLGGNVLSLKPEYEDCKKIAKDADLPLREVARKVEERAWKEIGNRRVGSLKG